MFHSLAAAQTSKRLSHGFVSLSWRGSGGVRPTPAIPGFGTSVNRKPGSTRQKGKSLKDTCYKTEHVHNPSNQKAKWNSVKGEVQRKHYSLLNNEVRLTFYGQVMSLRYEGWPIIGSLR